MIPETLVFISGIVPGPTGVGEVISHLLSNNEEHVKEGALPCQFIFRSGGIPLKRFLRERQFAYALRTIGRALYGELRFRSGHPSINRCSPVVLIHPQSLGFGWCLRFIEKSHNPVWIYLMDSSFFCVRSYNYIPDEDSACIRCLGGHFDNQITHSCRPEPRNDLSALTFVTSLRKLVGSQKVMLIAQSEGQAILARKHFGNNTVVKVAGLWANDWMIDNELCDPSSKSASDYHVIFHGNPIVAKGAKWAISVADRLRDYKFFFPFSKQSLTGFPPPNCTFQPMSWHSGLRDLIRSSPLAVVPSLWSAPIEGALIKSLHSAKITAVVSNETAFSQEIPDKIIIKLPFKVEYASTMLEGVLRGDRTIDHAQKSRYLMQFENVNKGLLMRLKKLIFNT